MMILTEEGSAFRLHDPIEVASRNLESMNEEEFENCLLKKLREHKNAGKSFESILGTIPPYWFDERPIGPNDTEAGRQMNRRIEVTVL